MSKLSSVMIFTVGAAIGSVITWKLLETKYEKIVQEEIDSVKEVFARSYESNTDEEEDVEEDESEPVKVATVLHQPEKPDITDYAAMTRDLGYTEKKEETELDKSKPYVIDPNDFGMEDDYNTESRLYHTDKFITDENFNLVNDIEDTIGFECLNTFGQYEEDAVYVRNELLKTDYEILRVDTAYEDVKDE